MTYLTSLNNFYANNSKRIDSFAFASLFVFSSNACIFMVNYNNKLNEYENRKIKDKITKDVEIGFAVTAVASIAGAIIGAVLSPTLSGLYILVAYASKYLKFVYYNDLTDEVKN